MKLFNICQYIIACNKNLFLMKLMHYKTHDLLEHSSNNKFFFFIKIFQYQFLVQNTVCLDRTLRLRLDVERPFFLSHYRYKQFLRNGWGRKWDLKRIVSEFRCSNKSLLYNLKHKQDRNSLPLSLNVSNQNKSVYNLPFTARR